MVNSKLLLLNNKQLVWYTSGYSTGDNNGYKMSTPLTTSLDATVDGFQCDELCTVSVVVLTLTPSSLRRQLRHTWRKDKRKNKSPILLPVGGHNLLDKIQCVDRSP